MGLPPKLSNLEPDLIRGRIEELNEETYLTLELDVWPGAMGVEYAMQLSADLETWAETGQEILPSIQNPNGTVTRRFRSDSPVEQHHQQFVRMMMSAP